MEPCLGGKKSGEWSRKSQNHSAFALLNDQFIVKRQTDSTRMGGRLGVAAGLRVFVGFAVLGAVVQATCDQYNVGSWGVSEGGRG